MAAYVQIKDIEGESVDPDHKNWINLASMSQPIHRSIPSGAQGVQRKQGETTCGDVVFVRTADKSSPLVAQACASGTFYDQVEVHFTTEIKDKSTTYLKYIFKNVIITSYNFHGSGSGSPLPSEEFTIGYTEVEWEWTHHNSDSGKKEGVVSAKYSPKK